MFRYVAEAAIVVLLAGALCGPAAGWQPPGGKAAEEKSEQPDKQLYDRAAADLRKKRFEQARLSLQVLINTYELSEYLAMAHLAIAESWFQQGGARNLAQARDECQVILLHYPGTPEAKAAQVMMNKIDEPPKSRK
jgi:outer membrane protein assembly factor BamD